MNYQHASPEYVALAGTITSDVAAKLSQRYNMRVVGVTEGMADCVNLLGLEFQIRGPLSKERLRVIVVDGELTLDLVEKALNTVRQQELTQWCNNSFYP